MAINWTDARQRSASLDTATESATQLAANLRRAALAARDAYVAEMTARTVSAAADAARSSAIPPGD